MIAKDSRRGFSFSRRGFLGALVIAGGLPVGIARAAAGAKPVRFGLSSFPPNLHPFEYTGTASLTVKLMLYRGLLSYAPDGTLRPELAQEWRQVDPVTYEFVLRENARFHDGTPVLAEDVKYSFELIADEKSTAHLRKDFQIVKTFEVFGERSLRIVLKQPSVTFPQVLAAGYAVVVSRRSAAPNFIGAGPFTLDNVERGSSVTVKAFPEFFRAGVPGPSAIHFIAMPDESLRIAALESGDVDIIEYVSTQYFDRLKNGADVGLESANGPFMYLLFNVQEGPFTDPRLRHAVACGIDRNAVNAAAFSGVGTPFDHLPVPPSPAYDAALVSERFSYDPARAKALLAEAGVGGGLVIELLSTSQYAQHNDTALVIQQNLAEIGINANLSLPDWATRVSRGNRGQYHLAVQGTAGAFNDPDAVSAYIEGGQVPSYTRPFGYNNARVNELLSAGRQEMDNAKRQKIYAEIDGLIVQDAPLLSLLWRPQAYGVRRSIRNFAPLPGFLSFQSALRLEDVTSA